MPKVVKRAAERAGGVKILKVDGVDVAPPAAPRKPAKSVRKYPLREPLRASRAVPVVQAEKGKPEPEPAAPVARVAGVSGLGMHSLRALVGAPNVSAEQEERDAKRASERLQSIEKAAKSLTDQPAGASPSVINRPVPQVTNFDHTGSRLPDPEAHLSAVYFAITEQYVRAHRLPITLGAAELAGATGLTAEQVVDAISELEKRRMLSRQPGRAGSLPRFAPAAI